MTLFAFLRAPYIVAWLNPDYGEMIVARDKHDHVRGSARSPDIAPRTYEDLVARVRALGYPVEDLRKVPQQWPQDQAATSNPDAGPAA